MNIFDVQASISLDTSKFEKGVSSAQGSADKLGSSLSSGSKGFDEMGNKSDKAKTSTEGFAKSADSTAKAVQSVGEKTKAESSNMEGLSGTVDKVKSSMTGAESGVKSLGTVISTLGSDTNGTEVELKDVGASAKQSGSDANSAGSGFSTLGDKVKSAGATVTAVKGDFSGIGDGIKSSVEEAAQSTESSLSGIGSKISSTFGNIVEGVKSKFSGFGETVSGAMKKSSSETDTAGNKMKVMEARVTAAKSKVNELSQAFNESVQKTGAQSKASQELAQKLNDAESEVEGLTQKLDGMQGLTMLAVADQLSGVGDKIKSFGSAAQSSFLAIGDATTKVSSYFGETGAKAEQTASVIKSVFESGVGESMDSVANAIVTVRRNLGDIDNVTLGNITTQALQLEDHFGIDMSESIRGVSALMTHFGLSATEAMDYLVAGTQNGLDKTDELGDNISEYSGKFAQAGYTTSEYFQILTNGLQGGAYNLDKVNDSINEVTNKLADGTIGDSIGSYSQKTQELFEAWQNGGATQKDVIDSIVSDIQNCDNQQQQLNMATTAFGTLAEDGSLRFVEALGAVGDQYDNVSGKAAAFAEQSMTPTQQLEANMRQLQDALAPVGDTLTQFANTILPPITTGIQILSNAFSQLPQPVQDFAVGLGIALTAITTLLPIIAAVKLLISSAFGAGFLATLGPIALVVAAITAAIVVFKNWGAVSDFVKSKWGDFKDWIGGIWEGLTGKATEVGEGIKTAFGDIKDGIVEKFTGIGEAMQSAFSGIVEWIATNIVQPIIDGFGTIKDGIVEKFTSIGEGISAAFETIGNLVQVGMMLIAEVISAAAQILLLPFNFIWQNFGTQITEFFTGIATQVQGFFATLGELFMAGWNAIVNTVSTVLSPIVTTIQTIWTQITSTVSTALSTLYAQISSVFTQIVSTISSIWSGIVGIVSSVWSQIVSTVSSAASAVWNAATNAFNSLRASVTSIMVGVMAAISNAWQNIKSTVSSAVSGIQSAVSNGFNAIRNTVSSICNGIRNAVSTPFNAIKNTISNVMNGAKNTVSNALNSIKSAFNGLHLKFPSIKLPHFSISGSFSINPPSVPHFSVSWYKRAMNGAYLLDSPQLFMNGSSLAGGGEAGNEYIVGQQSLANTVRTQMDDAIAAGLETIENQLNVVIGHIAEGKNIYIDKDQLVGATANAIDKKLGENRQRFRRGLA